ncbi:MAG: UvrD-helicase domain-containing protein [Nitriliruptor sp.]
MSDVPHAAPDRPLTPAPIEPLELTGDLPTGTVVLEASAGTGKTYAIAALATRAVAEGTCTVDQLLVVTFTRAATAELRDRVRHRFVAAERHLRAVLAGTAHPDDTGDDQVLAHLAAADRPELERRHGRLSAALTDFDAATISTIHGFTQQVLRSVGLSADVPRDITLIEDETTLVEEGTDDVYVRRYLDAADAARPSRSNAIAIARAVNGAPDADIRPDDEPDAGDEGAERSALAELLRDELATRKRRDGILGYDDLLTSLRCTLRDTGRGDAAVAILRDRYRWALIDEFQDTDPVQWDILRRAFRDPGDPSRALVLIGDPKQAIYSFRGADIRAYLDATATADHRRSLATNFRSDAPLLAALDRLLERTAFGAGIDFASVTASDRHQGSALDDDRDPHPLQLRVFAPDDKLTAASVRRRLATDVAETLLDQLGRVRIGTGRDQHLLRPEDVAVLVRTNAEARLVQRALRDVRIPCVVNGVGSVLATDAADDWRWLLESLERPSDPGRIRRLALSCWIGWTAARLADADDDELDHLHDLAHRWAAVMADHGVARLERVVLAEQQVARRLLGTIGGERHLTDVRHVGELLHVAELEEDRGVSSLRAWLLDARAEAGDKAVPSDEQARRLESDAACVQILTVHRAKGLQYPVVLVPFHWSAGRGITAPFVTYDPDTRRRTIEVGPKERAGYGRLRDAAEADATGEALRLLYVAVTRAEHRAVVWWTGSARKAALARVLFGHDEDGTVQLDVDATVPKPADQADVLAERFAGSPTSVTTIPDAPTDEPGTYEPVTDRSSALGAASFARTLDRAWRRTSYSGIVKRAESLHGAVPGHPTDHRATVASEPDVDTKDDEPDDDATFDGPSPAPGGDGSPATLDRPLPLGELRGGTAFGTFVHAVLEHADFAAEDLPAELRGTVEDQIGHHRVPGLTPDRLPELVDGLAAAVRSPLGPLAGGVTEVGDARGLWRSLADLPRTDRLDELEFELPLAGGDLGHRDGAKVALSRLADLLHRPAAAGGLADDDPLRQVDYADRLRTPGFALDLRGYLNGSIDLVLRVTDPAGTRYLVCDHKTNRLGGGTPTLADYRPRALTDAMVHHDYPLQALLYSVALHRFLRWRVADYDPDTHLGGVLYLFLRGMVGPDTPELDGGPCGVFAWRPPAAVVTDLSDLLDGVGDGASHLAAEVPA